jgi:hypothetical protein
MSRSATNTGHTKFQRDRESYRSRGMKLLRVWVPDPLAPGFQAEAARQAATLRAAPEEAEALDFIEAVADLENG